MKNTFRRVTESEKLFWAVEQKSERLIVTSGTIGTLGISKTTIFSSAAEAEQEAKSLTEKMKQEGFSKATADLSVVRTHDIFVDKPIEVLGSKLLSDVAVKIRSGYDDEVKVNEHLENLSLHQNAKDLDTMLIGAWQDSYDSGPKEILKKLIALKGSFSGLRHLFLGDMDSEECEMSWIQQTSYSDFYEHFPLLETLGTRGGEGLHLGKIELPNLKNLVIESGGLSHTVIQDIVNSELENLEHLELWLGTEDYGCNITLEHLLPLIKKPFPKLRYLGLKNYDHTSEIAKALLDIDFPSSLHTLDLSMGTLKDEGAEALYNNDRLLSLQHVNCRHHYLSDAWTEKLKDKFAEQKINLNDPAEQYDDEEYYYVEIGE